MIGDTFVTIDLLYFLEVVLEVNLCTVERKKSSSVKIR